MFLAKLFGRKSESGSAHTLYSAAVMRAREPVFYLDFAVPDTLEGRFEMIAFHVFLILRRLKSAPGEAGAGNVPAADGNSDPCNVLGQALFDLMFADMDRNLREMGAGDLGVGRRVKAMAAAFYGRIKAYDAGLAAGEAALSAAIARNVFNQTDNQADLGPDSQAIASQMLARYMIDSVTVLNNLPDQAMIGGEVAFAPLPSMVSTQ